MANKNPRCPVCGHPLRPIQQGTPEKRFTLGQQILRFWPNNPYFLFARAKQQTVVYLLCDSCEFEAPASRFTKNKKK